jgi:hypothetical protein
VKSPRQPRGGWRGAARDRSDVRTNRDRSS